MSLSSIGKLPNSRNSEGGPAIIMSDSGIDIRLTSKFNGVADADLGGFHGEDSELDAVMIE